MTVVEEKKYFLHIRVRPAPTEAPVHLHTKREIEEALNISNLSGFDVYEVVTLPRLVKCETKVKVSVI